MIAGAGTAGKSLPVELDDKTFATRNERRSRAPKEASVTDDAPNQATDENEGAAEVKAADAAASSPAGESGSDRAEVTTHANHLASETEGHTSRKSPQTRNLLKIEVAVAVELAHQRLPIHDIIEMGPGTLVKFEKTYEEPLELTIDGLPIARGEVVKVGDKFGLRIGKLVRG